MIELDEGTQPAEGGTQTETKRKPGRPPKSGAKGAAANRSRPNPENRMDRPERLTMGSMDLLAVPKMPGFKLRWFMDELGRVDAAQQLGWVPVSRDELNFGRFAIESDGTANRATQLGNAVMRPAGGGRWYVLMKCPEEIYNARFEKKMERIDRVEDAMHTPAGAAGIAGGIDDPNYAYRVR